MTSNPSTLDLPVHGMTCAACVRRVEKALVRVEGVTQADVNLITGQARISFDPSRHDHEATVEALRKAVESAGYEVEREPLEPTTSLATFASPTTVTALTSATVARMAPSTAAAVAPSTAVGTVAPSTTVATVEPSTNETTVEPPTRRVTLDTATTRRDEDDAREQRALLRELVITATLAAPLLLLAMSHGTLSWTDRAWARWSQLALATPVVLGPGRRFFVGAWKATIHGTADMSTLVALGVGAAWAYSAIALVAPDLFTPTGHEMQPPLYFEASVAIVGFVLLGKLLETRARRGLSDAVRGLVSLRPSIAHRLEDSRRETDVPVASLRVGERIVIRPGERIPVDAMVLEGASSVDESMLTGESIAVDRVSGHALTGGTLNQTGSLVARVTATGKNTVLSRIVEAVEQAQGSKAPVARLADEVSARFVPIVLGLAVLTFVAWTFVVPLATPAISWSSADARLSVALERFVAVLVIACPCALGLATPAAVAAGTGRAAQLGVLFKGGAALEIAHRIDTVLIDKTGTLTTGHPALVEVIPLTCGAEDVDATEPARESLLALVASAEQRSEHPIARAIVDAALARGLLLPPTVSFRSEPGAGIETTVAGGLVLAGTARWLEERGVECSALSKRADELASRGHTPILVALDGALVGLVTVADRVVPEARAAIASLRAMSIEVAMVTGDREGTARAIATELGIDRVHAEIRPVQKAALVAEARARGRHVAMVGDGVNDAPALAAADVGIALGTGSDIAASSADIVLLRGGISSLPTALLLARRTLHTIRQNLFWAFVYNVIGIPIAAGILYPWTGLLLSPVLASAAMSLSSVSVITNSLRLRRFTVRTPK